MENKKRFLNFYDVTVSICGDEEIVSKLIRDFGFFLTQEQSDENIKLNIKYEQPP